MDALPQDCILRIATYFDIKTWSVFRQTRIAYRDYLTEDRTHFMELVIMRTYATLCRKLYLSVDKSNDKISSLKTDMQLL